MPTKIFSLSSLTPWEDQQKEKSELDDALYPPLDQTHYLLESLMMQVEHLGIQQTKAFRELTLSINLYTA